MHIIIALMAFGLFITFFTMVRQGEGKNNALKKAQKQDYQKLQAQLNEILDKQNELEKRIQNVELIVTDSKFIDLPDAKESINIKQEMEELKDLMSQIVRKK